MIGVIDFNNEGKLILEKIFKELPDYEYICYKESNYDFKNVSYQELCNHVFLIIQSLIHYEVKIIVIASSIISNSCHNYLKKVFSIPIIYLKPSYKLLYNLKNKTIVLDTKENINENTYIELFQKYSNHNTVLISYQYNNNLNNLFKNDLDAKNIIIGSPSLLFIKNNIKKVFNNINIIDGINDIILDIKLTIKGIRLQMSKYNVIYLNTIDK